jgi:hypothetical protein
MTSTSHTVSVVVTRKHFRRVKEDAYKAAPFGLCSLTQRSKETEQRFYQR